MALSTYAQLRQAVADWLDRRDLGDRIPDFIALAESRLNRLLRLRAMEVEVAIQAPAGTDWVDLPADCLEPLGVWRKAEGGRQALSFQTGAGLSRTGLSGPPRAWSLQGDGIRLDRPCETFTELSVAMRQRVRLSDSAPTNPVLASCPDLYLFGSLIEAAPYLRDGDLLALFAARYGAALAEANALEARPLGLARLRPEAGLPC